MLEFFTKPVGAALVGAALMAFQPGIANAQDAKPKDSETARMLRTMHGYLKTNDLAFRSQFSTNDKVLGGSRSGIAEFSVRGANLFRVNISGGGRSELFVSDGKVLWVYRSASRKFVKFAAKDSVLGTMYAATGLMFMPTRILDAFWTVDYLETVEEDVSIKPLSDAKVSGRDCRGVRVVRFEDMFDFWLDPAAPNLPCKLVSRRSDGSSEAVTTHVFTWNTKPDFPAATFQFSPPKGAREADAF